MARKKIRSIGILTSGDDCQGLNAAIRAVAKTAMKSYGMDGIGIGGGGTPTAADRTLATVLGSEAARLLAKGVSGVMVGMRGQTPVPVGLSQVAGKRRNVPVDHPWLQTLRRLNICLGD